MSFISTKLRIFSCFTMIFVVSLFSNVFSLGANKEDLLHVTHRIISSLPFGWNSSFSGLFQHFMLLTYEHEMSFLCLGMNIVFSPSLWFALILYVQHQVRFTSICVHYMKKTIKKNLKNQKMKDVLFSSMFFLCF